MPDPPADLPPVGPDPAKVHEYVECDRKAPCKAKPSYPHCGECGCPQDTPNHEEATRRG
jgi:hypothetical protein